MVIERRLSVESEGKSFFVDINVSNPSFKHFNWLLFVACNTSKYLLLM